MMYNISHKTKYTYNEQVSLCQNIAKLFPRNTDIQKCLKSEITIFPEPDVVNEYEDYFGNKSVYFSLQKAHEELTVTVNSLIEKQKDETEISLIDQLSWEIVKGMLYEPKQEYFEARQFIQETAMTSSNQAIVEYTLKSFIKGRPFIEASENLMQRIFKDFKFQPGFTTIATPPSEVMKHKKGVCQDFAHLALACIRSLGLPARYVSGYIETVPPDGKEKLVGADASHAWFSIFVPNIGWVDFDPTNNMIPSQKHITIGWGRDYRDIVPLKGVIFSSDNHKLSVEVDVRRA
jgi:transglutaminase-like putative cysteine protease